MWILIEFPSGCRFTLLRHDAAPFGFPTRFWRVFLLFLRPLGVLLGFLGALLGASWSLLGRSWAVLGRNWVVSGRLLGSLGAILGHLEAKLGGLGATSGALRFFHIFWNHFGSKKGPQREAFWEPKRSKNRSKNEVQIEEQKSRLLEFSWCDFGSISKRSLGQKY